MAKAKSQKASLSALEKLHATVADELAKRIKRPDATAADLQAAIKFLKDNGVEVTSGEVLEDLKGAVTGELLPFPAGEEPTVRKKKAS